MTIRTVLVCAALALPASATADDKTQPVDKTYPTDKTKPVDKTRPDKQAKLSDSDIKIVAHVHHINVMEVDLGKLAQRSGTDSVKRYGEQLVRDHSTADTELIAFAKARGVPNIPPAKADTPADQAAMKEMMDSAAKLKTLKGAEFDRAYLNLMVTGHDRELASTDPMIARATEPELKKLLEDRRSSLQRHSDMAKDLQRGTQISTGPVTPPPAPPAPPPPPPAPPTPN